ncbi:MAG TPA: hypothetical protein VJ045_09700 [Hyphomicrobiaceae bacterium]|nr:hypothetical protein [Hyphomicrobiaceae bacterium]
MIVCSCAVISDRDLEEAVLEIMSEPNAPIPTPGVVYKQLAKRMTCCGCAPLAIETIYAKMEDLERRGLICPWACATAKSRLREFSMANARAVPRARRARALERSRPAEPPRSPSRAGIRS